MLFPLNSRLADFFPGSPAEKFPDFDRVSQL